MKAYVGREERFRSRWGRRHDALCEIEALPGKLRFPRRPALDLDVRSMSLERGLFHYATLLLGLVGLLGTFGFLALLVVMTPASWPSVVIATISFAPFWAFMAFLPRFAWWVRVEGVDPESQPVTAYVGVINKWGAGSKALGRSLMGRMEGAS